MDMWDMALERRDKKLLEKLYNEKIYGFRTGCWLLHWIFKQAFCGDVVVVLDMVVAEYLSSLKAPRMEVTPKMLEFMRNLRKTTEELGNVFTSPICTWILIKWKKSIMMRFQGGMPWYMLQKFQVVFFYVLI